MTSLDCSPGAGEPGSKSVLEILAVIVGWMYFFCWSVCYYPQVYLNFRRKSVVGFSFDFVYLNIVGYFAYSIYNITLYSNPVAQLQYCEKHGPPNPVHLNDIFFAVHGFTLGCIETVQCFYYDRGTQYVSAFGFSLGMLMWLWSWIVIYLWMGDVLDLLSMITKLSDVKLASALFKYMPQAWSNYRRKSTEGFSVFYVMLDFSGGVLSLLQGVLLWIDSGEVSALLGDPAKFGLSLIALSFDSTFLVQHYILYGDKSKKMVEVKEEEEGALLDSAGSGIQYGKKENIFVDE
mmetsp:Transcript_8819/g.11858  ORF Transcript_8819/g.11858 Transcript_8819/m.11858 type:complete len:291 (-) Transcript_8819:15-887(-)